MRVAARYLPGSNEAEIGGDWYDVITLRDGQIGLAIGDVVGRGVKAAARMAHLQSAVRAYALEGLRPSVVLERTNSFALELERPRDGHPALRDSRFGGRNASLRRRRPPAAARDPTGPGASPTPRPPPGNPVGAVGFAAYEESVTTIEPGSVVLLYTDGLVERPDVSLDDGLDALRAAVQELPPSPTRSAGRCPRRVLERAPTDDTALLAP